MKRFSANYSCTNHNFVIQNLGDDRVNSVYTPAISIIKNILQRGCPTRPSKYIESCIGTIDKRSSIPLISNKVPQWERIIRGDKKNNYNPAYIFFYKLIPKYFIEFPFLQQLIVPEVPINTITQIEVLEFQDQQVDFFIPCAFLVIEIDGSSHDIKKDNERDKHLLKYGIKTIRISTYDVEHENKGLIGKIKDIKGHLNEVQELQKQEKQVGILSYSLTDYMDAFNAPNHVPTVEYISTSIIRFQLMILELLEIGKLDFDHAWEINVRSDQQDDFDIIACKDLFLWFKNLFQLQRVAFSEPTLKIIKCPSIEELKLQKGLKIDFSIEQRYTDEFQNNSDIIFVRTDYLESYRYYKNTNSITPEYVGLAQYNFFEVSIAELLSYKIQIGGNWKPELALAFFLENIFGYTTFYPGQLPILVNALSRNDTIGLLPTGGGKSVCYQLAALLQPGISFIVCPIKSLMYDQKHDLHSNSISRVNHITSDDDGEDKEKIMSEFAQGKYLFIFISPERFQIKAFRQYLLTVNTNYKIAYAVVDEVHCLSEWGHDFRTSYLNLSKTIKKHCSGFRFIGLTATASINVLKDIQIEFGIKRENIKTLTDYTRPELDFEIIDDNNNKMRAIKELIHQVNDQQSIFQIEGKDSKCGIIFTPHVNGSKGCYALSKELEKEFRTPVKFYSGQVPKVNKVPVMSSNEFEIYKREVQIEFKENAFTLLAATKAFGMGVNKGNIFYTIHFGIPGSMEALYQEAGRAGRDKKRFEANSAKCLVLFTKTTDQDELQKVWDRKTTLSGILAVLPKIDGDINTNLFLFQSGMEVIKDEYGLIFDIISKYASPSKKTVKIFSNDLSSTKFKTEKAIYRLAQLGIIEDWTIQNFFSGVFEVDFANYDEQTITDNLLLTINKYVPDFSLDTLETNVSFVEYLKIWQKKVPLIDRCVVLLLQWAYDHFAYNRRQSLKNIYESCEGYVSEKISKQEFKQQLENYFKFSEASFLLQHVAENPNEIAKWFEVFYDQDEKSTDRQIINWEQRQSLLANLSRILESYEYSTGLDLISGLLRLLLDDFKNADGENRLISALSQVSTFEELQINFILENILNIGDVMSSQSKFNLARTILSIYPNNLVILKKVQHSLGDDHSTEKLLSHLIPRIQVLNQKIHEQFI